MNIPPFSIIIPTYNRAGFIAKSIQSALAQQYPDFEVIVIDDGSTDNTEEVVKNITDDRIKYYKKPNAERGAARNFGVARARGQYITFLDSDDLLYKHYLSNAAEAIAKFRQPPFLHLAYEVTNEHLHPKYRINHLRSDNIRIFIWGNPLSCMGVFLRRDIARKYPFSEDRELSGSEDWELWIRIAANEGIKTDNRISAALIDHESRSVVQYAFADAAVQKKFTNYRKQMESYWDSYTALHLVLSRQNRKGLTFLTKSLILYPPAIVERRTLAIVKHAALNLLR
jgi:glycosyltransferase involved in cell wall biosynthesis